MCKECAMGRRMHLELRTDNNHGKRGKYNSHGALDLNFL